MRFQDKSRLFEFEFRRLEDKSRLFLRQIKDVIVQILAVLGQINAVFDKSRLFILFYFNPDNFRTNLICLMTYPGCLGMNPGCFRTNPCCFRKPPGWLIKNICCFRTFPYCLKTKSGLFRINPGCFFLTFPGYY